MTNMYFQVCSLFYMIMISTLFLKKERVKNNETKIFTIMSATNIIGIVLDIIIVYLSYVLPNNPSLYILNKIYLLYIVFWASFFYKYISYISIKDNYKKAFHYIFIIMIILSIIFVPILPIYLFNENNVMYTYGPSVYATYLIVFIFFIFVTIMVLTNIKKIFTKKYTPVFILLLLCILTFIVRQINPSLLLTTTIITYINVVMYFTIENPDVKMIEQLNVAKTQAEKANNAKTDFLSSMSHEIRTPLNAIVGFSQCIETSDTLEDAKENAQDVVSASLTLLELVNGILDISKIEAGKLEIINSKYNSKILFDSSVKLIKARLGDKELDFKVTIADDIPETLYGDHSNLKKIIINLLTNAIKYTDKGFVHFTVNSVNTNDVCRLVISVEDSGRGIKKEDIDKLFTKFQRLDEDINTTIEGTGLGLAITKQLIELMGGKIVVQSTYGQGSKFTVALDQRIEHTTEKAVKQEEDDVLDFSDKTILIVDDNNLNLKVATKLMAKYKLKIDTLNSGQECINKIRSGYKYDLILMDDMMPYMSGVEALKVLKQIENFRIPVVVLTANAITGIREKYISDGFNDYLSKPIEQNNLRRILTRYLTNGIPDNKAENLVVEKKDEIDLSNKRILVVDDNSLNIKVAQTLLKNYNPKIDYVMSGFECLDKINSGEKYDLIFMDDMMPDMSGVETFHKIKESNNYNEPIVVLTANAIEGSREKYLNEGFNDYISKPINKNELIRILKEFIIKK